MNPLTQIKNTQKISKEEILQGVPESASWHARYKHSAYIYAGGLPFDLTEGDVLTVFAQYGELVDVHNVKDKDTGKYRGFSFLAYEDQRSTVLAVDNLNGATVGHRTVRVEHVDNYKKKKAEVEGREESPSEDEEGDAEPDQAQPAIQETAAAKLAGNDMPWAASDSIFSMLNQPNSMLPPPPRLSAHAKETNSHKRTKEKKEKKEKKHKRHKASPEPADEADLAYDSSSMGARGHRTSAGNIQDSMEDTDVRRRHGPARPADEADNGAAEDREALYQRRHHHHSSHDRVADRHEQSRSKFDTERHQNNDSRHHRGSQRPSDSDRKHLYK